MRHEGDSYLPPARRQTLSMAENRQITAPTAEQVARRKERKRFNRLVITLPLGIVFLLWAVAILGMFWLAVVGEWFAIDTNQAAYRGLFSGIADIFTMLLLAPMLLLCALPIAAAVALVVYRRKKRRESDRDEPSIPILWKVENTVVMVRDTVARTMPKVAQPVINTHATVAHIRQLLRTLKRIVRQEINRNNE